MFRISYADVEPRLYPRLACLRPLVPAGWVSMGRPWPRCCLLGGPSPGSPCGPVTRARSNPIPRSEVSAGPPRRLAGRRRRRRAGQRPRRAGCCAPVWPWSAGWPPIPAPSGNALGVGTRLWLLSNGVSAPLGGMAVTLVPWGATAVVAFMLSWFAGVRRAAGPRRAAGRTVTVAGVLLATLPGPGAGHRGLAGPALARAAALGGRHRRCSRCPRAWGGSRALGRRLTDGLAGLGAGPAAGRPRRPAGAAGRRGRAGAGHRADPPPGPGHALCTRRSDPGVAGGIALLMAQLALVPNALVWAASYALGSGFVARRRLGRRPRRAPSWACCPACRCWAPCPPPVRAARRCCGGWRPGPWPADVAAWIVVRVPAGAAVRREQPGRRPGRSAGRRCVRRARPGPPAATSGAVRLTGLGPRLLPLLVMAGTTMGLAGMITGLVSVCFGYVARRRSGWSAGSGD